MDAFGALLIFDGAGFVLFGTDDLDDDDLGRASRPSKIRVKRRSSRRMVSSTQRSSPYMAFSIESRIWDSRISLVIMLELRQSVETRPVRVEIETTAAGRWLVLVLGI